MPIYEVLKVPLENDKVILVMPLLRSWDEPAFETVGEGVDFFQQLFEVCAVLYTPPRVLVESARTARTHSDSVRTPHRLCGFLMILGVHTKITL